MDKSIVTKEHLDIFLKYMGYDPYFLLRPSKKEMSIMSPKIWLRIHDLYNVSCLLRNSQNKEFQNFADSFFSESCENQEVEQRIRDIDPKDLFFE